MSYLALAVETVRRRLSELNPEINPNAIIGFFVCIRIETFLKVQFDLKDDEIDSLLDTLNEATDEIIREICPDTFERDTWLCSGMIHLAPIHLQKSATAHAVWLKEHRLKLLDRLAERFK